MLKPGSLQRVLFFDVETAAARPDYSGYSAVMQKHWERKARRMNEYDAAAGEEQFEELYHERAAIFAEFARVVCISCGIYAGDPQTADFALRSVAGGNERELLIKFREILNKHIPELPMRNNPAYLCGHNIQGFDVPMLSRRYLINGLELPVALDVANLKPWDMTHLLDTQSYWRFGDFRHFVPLELLTELFGHPTPKDALGGAYVSSTFWDKKDLHSIAFYCEEDVVATARVALSLSNLAPVAENKLDRKEMVKCGEPGER